MSPTAENVAARYLEPSEVLRAAFSAYTKIGLGRRVIALTGVRMLVLKSSYWSITDKGLLWADPLEQLALPGSYSIWLTEGFNTGNAYVRIRRPDGSILQLNPRNSFIGQIDSAAANIELLYSLIPNRY
jgi:hypothetical protein